MFYSQVILSKKGPLGKVWQAAHWGDKKLSRPAIFATNLEDTVDAIVDPAAPLALRVSSHLLWGVVRIYSRKVEYLLDDCHQAVTKVNRVPKSTTTSTQASSRAKIDLPARGSNTKNQLNVSHFGEFTASAVADDLGAMAVDFEIPFDLEKETTEEDWLPAELPDDTVPLQIPEPDVPEARNNKDQENDEDENWGNVEFNPFDDEDEEEEGGKPRNSKGTDNSTVSDLEKPRQAPADQSVTSLNNAPNDTSSLEISRTNASTGVDNGDADNMMFDNGDDMMPFDDQSATQAVDISEGKSMDGGGIDFGSPPLRGVSPSASEKSADQEITQKRRRTNEEKKKKKRKILIDEGEIVLTTGEIKDMLNHTTSIAPPAVHPTEEEPAHKKNSLLEDHSMEELFQRPVIGDDAYLAPALVALWARSTATVAGKPFQYELNTKDEDEATKSLEDGEPGVPRDGDDDMPPMDNDVSMPLSDEEMPPMMDDEDGPNIPFDNDDQPSMEMGGRDSPIHSDGSVFSLGAANDLDDMQMDEPLTSAKWHKNTVKVFEVLKHNLQQDDTEHVSFEILSKNTSRRTAVGFFFEMLQLKTLDYIEIHQDGSYGDINISEGVRFAEDPPEAQQT